MLNLNEKILVTLNREKVAHLSQIDAFRTIFLQYVASIIKRLSTTQQQLIIHALCLRLKHVKNTEENETKLTVFRCAICGNLSLSVLPTASPQKTIIVNRTY